MLDRELFLLPFDFLALDSSSVKWPFWLFPSLSASAWSILDTSRDNVYKLSPVSCPVLQKCQRWAQNVQLCLARFLCGNAKCVGRRWVVS